MGRFLKTNRLQANDRSVLVVFDSAIQRHLHNTFLCRHILPGMQMLRLDFLRKIFNKIPSTYRAQVLTSMHSLHRFSLALPDSLCH